MCARRPLTCGLFLQNILLVVRDQDREPKYSCAVMHSLFLLVHSKPLVSVEFSFGSSVNLSSRSRCVAAELYNEYFDVAVREQRCRKTKLTSSIMSRRSGIPHVSQQHDGGGESELREFVARRPGAPTSRLENASSLRTAGDGSQQPPPPPAAATREMLEEYRTTETHVSKRLNDVRVVIDEFYEDVDLAIVRKSEENKGNVTQLQQFVSALRRVPLLPDEDWQRFPPVRRAQVRTQKKESIMNLFSNLIDREQDRKLLTLDLAMMVLALLSLILMIVADSLVWVLPSYQGPSRSLTRTLPLPPTSEPSPSSSAPSGPPAQTPVPIFTPAPPGTTDVENVIGSVRVSTYLILHYVMFALGIVFCVALTVYYRLQLGYRRLAWSKMAGKQILPKSEAYSFFRSSMAPSYAAEVLIFMIMPYPWYNQLNSQDSKYLQIFMFCRIYLCFRFLFHYSQLYRNRNQILRSSEFLRRASFHVEFWDTMKVYFFENTLLTATLLYVAVVTIGGFCVFLAERNANSNSIDDPQGSSHFSSFFQGVYFMVIAIRTIGYGDVQATTIVGRALTVIFQFTGVAVELLIASVVVNKIAKTKEEKIVDEYLESFLAWCELRVASAMVIQAFWKTSLRYSYLHRKASEEAMQQLIRAMKRRREYLKVLQVNRARSAVRDTDGSSVVTQLRQEENMVANDANFKQLVRHFASADKVAKNKKSDGEIFGVFNMNPNLEEEREEVYRRMPYLRERATNVSTQDLIDRDRHFFSQNIDVLRWNRSIGSKVPRGFRCIRKFTSSKKVIGKFGERRIPIGKGHKADIRLESLQNFREARLNFKRSIAPSSDHVIDTKLQIAYELLAAAAKKVRRNVILLQGLKRAAILEITSMKQLVQLSLSGGVPLPPQMELELNFSQAQAE